MIVCRQLCRAARAGHLPSAARRCQSTSSLAQRLSDPFQSYISTSRDPYLNLSIEHYLLQKSSPESTILFLYVNRPSVIIGRNQNPWLEVDLALINEDEDRPVGLKDIDLVRRRSGGGTVFHDEGNVNWTVICPSASFTRDKHAEMVVRALRGCGIERARVNERHDIVLDQGVREFPLDPADTHRTPYTDASDSVPRPLKVSGSAYKLTKGRALHHGTCLLSSPNLELISKCLRSPAKPYIKARGVGSVSSPVTNILLSNEHFETAVTEQFRDMYANYHGLDVGLDVMDVDDGMLDIPDVKKGYEELRSDEWKYLQTPFFSITNISDKSRLADIDLGVRHGIITGVLMGPSPQFIQPMRRYYLASETLLGTPLHEVRNWTSRLMKPFEEWDGDAMESAFYVLDWLDKMLPNVDRHKI